MITRVLLPELGLRLAGAVCDFTEPSTGQNELFSSGVDQNKSSRFAIKKTEV
ncbi:MAG: hypothetical protein HUJ72_01745 [Blautia sp.]|nr:hypothetical protein [Blautia sp.]